PEAAPHRPRRREPQALCRGRARGAQAPSGRAPRSRSWCDGRVWRPNAFSGRSWPRLVSGRSGAEMAVEPCLLKRPLKMLRLALGARAAIAAAVFLRAAFLFGPGFL